MSDFELGMEQVVQSGRVPELELWSTLTNAERRVLGTIFHKYAGQTFSSLLPSEDWAKEGLSGAEARLAFAMLRRKQWIKSVYKSWGEHSYHIPECYLSTLTSVYADRVGYAVEPMVASVKRVVKEGKAHIAGELLHLLAWIHREGLPLTGKGSIHKRSIQKLSTLTILSQDDFEHLEITYDHKDLYPVHVVILLDLLLCLNLLQKMDWGFEVRQDKLQQWIRLPWSVMHREIFRVCMDRYGGSGAEMQHFRYQLAGLTPGLKQWCRVPNPKGDIGIRSWLHALAGLGFGEVGEEKNGGLAFRWLTPPAELLKKETEHIQRSEMYKQEERQSSKFYVQPDFEVMVPPDVSAEVCWRLEHCSERITRDQMSIYRISKERLETAVSSGIKLESIVHFLRRHGQGELPGHILAALQDWAKGSETVPDHKLLLPLPLVSECPYAEKERQVGELETAQGMKTSERMEMNQNHFYKSETSGLIQRSHMPGMTAGHNDIDSDLDQDMDEKVAWSRRKADVPEIWHKEWRKYHLSTARQIAARAIEWQVKLGIQQGNDTFVLIPHQLEGHEQWMLEGWCILDSIPFASHIEWRTFTPEGWDTMRLILPDEV